MQWHHAYPQYCYKWVSVFTTGYPCYDSTKIKSILIYYLATCFRELLMGYWSSLDLGIPSVCSVLISLGYSPTHATFTTILHSLPDFTIFNIFQPWQLPLHHPWTSPYLLAKPHISTPSPSSIPIIFPIQSAVSSSLPFLSLLMFFPFSQDLLHFIIVIPSLSWRVSPVIYLPLIKHTAQVLYFN